MATMNGKGRALRIAACAGLACAMAATGARADFGANSLAIVRVGDGSITFDTTLKTQQVFVDVYNVSTNTPTLLNTLTLPAGLNAADRFVLSSRSDDHDGKLNYNVADQSLTIAGYRENVGVGVSSSNYVVTSTVPRVALNVTSGGVVTQAELGTAYAGVSVVAAAEKNGHFWVAGGNTAGDIGGLRYVAAPGQTSVNVTTQSFGTEPDSYRGLRLVGDQLQINTASQNAFKQTAPGGAGFYQRGAYLISQNGGLPTSDQPPASAALALMASNDAGYPNSGGNPALNFDAFGNTDFSGKGSYYPKSDAIYLDLNKDGVAETAYGTGGKEDVQKWHFNGTKWTRTESQDVMLITGKPEVNALSATFDGSVVSLYMSTDLGVYRLLDTGLTGGFVTADGKVTQDAINRVFTDTPYITAATNTQFRGLSAVPEPTALALLAALPLAMVRRRARRQK